MKQPNTDIREANQDPAFPIVTFFLAALLIGSSIVNLALPSDQGTLYGINLGVMLLTMVATGISSLLYYSRQDKKQSGKEPWFRTFIFVAIVAAIMSNILETVIRE